jgi:hypothetical protein
VRQLAHDHAIPHCHRAIWATARRNNVALGAQTGGLGQENTQGYYYFQMKKGPDMPGRGCSCVPTTGAGPERRHDSARSAAAANRKKWPRMSIRGQVGPSEGNTQQRWAPGSVSPLRGRPLAKARCFQGPGTAPRPWPPTAILIRTVPALIPGRASPRSNCGMSRFCGGWGSGWPTICHLGGLLAAMPSGTIP